MSGPARYADGPLGANELADQVGERGTASSRFLGLKDFRPDEPLVGRSSVIVT